MARRNGFTLVELLVALAIIGVMMALSLGTILGFARMAADSATKTTMNKIQRLQQHRLEQWNRRYGGSDSHTIARLHQTAEYHETAKLQTVTGDRLNENQRLILTRKLLYMRHNPQHKQDLAGPPWNIEAAKLATMDNSEILFYMLTSAPVFGDAPIGEDAFLQSEFADLDGDGSPCFVDGWKNPMHFWRWPTPLLHAQIDASGQQAGPHQVYASAVLQPVGRPADLARDPQDPLRQMLSVEGFAQQFHDPATFWAPLIMSAGPDGDIGLDDSGAPSIPWDSDLTDEENVQRRRDALLDNITSRRLKAGD